ncbi:MAG TPA: DNA repair protein RecO [Casimicrobiaceae bacterium]|nr:DNA repair protein RecO [Casimicrobiaceae bacterium]
MKQLRERHDDEPAFVLHTYAYRETSLIVEAFTERHGRVAMVARGAKRPRSEMRGVLQAFQPLALSWAGAGELKTLVKAEWQGGLPLPGGAALLCGFYLNELLLKLLAREDAHPALWRQYESALRALTANQAPGAQAATLRRFELRLLAELGYALTITRDVARDAPVEAGERYHYAFDRGPQHVAAEPRASWPVVRGETLLALATERYPDADIAAEAKRLMRGILDHYLEKRHIFSRRMVRDLAALEDRDVTSEGNRS